MVAVTKAANAIFKLIISQH